MLIDTKSLDNTKEPPIGIYFDLRTSMKDFQDFDDCAFFVVGCLCALCASWTCCATKRGWNFGLVTSDIDGIVIHDDDDGGVGLLDSTVKF